MKVKAKTLLIFAIAHNQTEGDDKPIFDGSANVNAIIFQSDCDCLVSLQNFLLKIPAIAVQSSCPDEIVLV